MYYIGLDVHKKTISYCVKDASGQVHQEGKVGATRRELDSWIKTLPQPRTMAVEATIFTGWIYDHLLLEQGWMRCLEETKGRGIVTPEQEIVDDAQAYEDGTLAEIK